MKRFIIIVIHAEFWALKKAWESPKINFLLTQCQIIVSNLLLIHPPIPTFRRTFGTFTIAFSSRSSSARLLVSLSFYFADGKYQTGDWGRKIRKHKINYSFIGYGNISPNNNFGRVFMIFYALIGTLKL